MFLDTKSSLVGDTISVALYTKPTDTHLYLLPTSCHPKYSWKKCCLQPWTSPQTYLLRFRHFWIRSKRTDWPPLQMGLSEKGKFHLILREQQNREDLLSYRPKSESSVLPFLLMYHPDLPEKRDIVNRHWPIIKSSSTLSEIFTERLIMAYRRPKSLQHLLVRAKLKPDMRDDEPLGKTRPCGKARCKTCKMITPHRSRSQHLGQPSSLGATLVVRRPMLSTL